jgi:hypothetical protein
MLSSKPIRLHLPRHVAWLVALTVLATGLVVLPATPAAADGLYVTITPTAGIPGSSALWSGQSTTLTASFNVINGLSEIMYIFDETAGQTVGLCTGQLAGGTFSCSAVVSQTGATTHVYYASAQEIAFWGGYTGQSRSTAVTWNLESVSLQTQSNGVASQNTVAVGTVVTLTAVSYLDVGPSPYYLEIFDLTAGTLIDLCAVGTTCSTKITENGPTTHVFRAYVTPYTDTPPVNGPYWRSADSYVTWNGGNQTVFLYFNESNTLIVYASAPAIPQGYVIEIFDENSGQPVASCAVSPCGYNNGGDGSVFDGYVAFIAPPANTTLPPAGFLASSNTKQTGLPAGPL